MVLNALTQITLTRIMGMDTLTRITLRRIMGLNILPSRPGDRRFVPSATGRILSVKKAIRSNKFLLTCHP